MYGQLFQYRYHNDWINKYNGDTKMCHRDKFNPLAKRFDMLEFNQTKILSDFTFNQSLEENQYTRKLFLKDYMCIYHG